MRLFKLSALLLLAILALLSLKTVLDGLAVLNSEQVFRKDLLQDYLLAKARVSGEALFTPISELEKRLIAESKDPLFPHASPHPPSIAIILYPLQLLNFRTFATVWFFADLLLLILISIKLLSLSGLRKKLPSVIAIMLVLLSSEAVYSGLIVGQFSIILSFLCLWAIESLIRNRDRLAGLLFGLCFVLKFFAWPLIIYLALTKRLRALYASLITIAFSATLSLSILGLNTWTQYFEEIAPNTVELYRADQANFSIATIGQRLFGGLEPRAKVSVSAPPLIDAPQLIEPVGVLIPILVFIVGILVALRAKDTLLACVCLLSVNVLVTPISWTHSLIILSPFGALFLNYLSRRDLNTPLGILAVVCLMLLHLGNRSAALVLAGQEQVTFSTSLITYLPMLALLLLISWCWAKSGDSRSAILPSLNGRLDDNAHGR